MSTSEPNSTSSSPRLSSTHTFPRPSPSLSRTSTRSISSAISTIPEDSVLDSPSPLGYNHSFSSHDNVRGDVQDLRAILTNLLNCDTIRSDPKMRTLVQSRLMDAEMQAKRQRRRKATNPAIVLTTTDDERRKCA